jgi:hypothetical protein
VEDKKYQVDKVAAKALSAPNETLFGNSGGPKNKDPQKQQEKANPKSQQNEKPGEKEPVAGNSDELKTDDAQKPNQKPTEKETKDGKINKNKDPQKQNKKADQKPQDGKE